MTSNYISFGINKITGRLMHIEEVKSGLACDCVCPECGSMLEARKGNMRTHHFAHAKHSTGNIKSVCVNARETSIHKAAKQCLVDRVKSIFYIPPEVLNLYYNREPIVISPGYSILVTDVKEEEWNSGVRPDITLYSFNYKLFIEIYVTHKAGEEKYIKLRSINTPCLEIDLSGFMERDSFSKEEFINAVFDNSGLKKWIFTPSIEELSKKKDQFSKYSIKSVDNEYEGLFFYIPECPLIHGNNSNCRVECNRCHFYAGCDMYCSIVFCSANQHINLDQIDMRDA